jgi:alanine racemase
MKPATYVELNLDAVQHNLTVVRSYSPHAKIMAVIKANGYGHGLLHIAKAAKQADGFGVARLAEAIRLRQAGFKQRIVLLEGFGCEEELQATAHYQLETVIHCFEQITLLEHLQDQEKITVWLKLDSGMNRLGFKTAEFNEAYQRLISCPHVNPEINFITHLANADNKHDPKTSAQIQLFNETVGEFKGERSIANSAGLLAWRDSLTDWVRPGLMLYGISPFPEQTGTQLGLKPVMSLHSRLIAVKQINPGESVGYSGTWVCDKPTRLGVIAVGYGDGYSRHAKIGTPVLVNGKRVPLIGRVSMDMITVDLNSQPDAKMADEVILWGDGLPVEEIALWADTIPYTLVCGITQRVHIVVHPFLKRL